MTSQISRPVIQDDGSRVDTRQHYLVDLIGIVIRLGAYYQKKKEKKKENRAYLSILYLDEALYLKGSLPYAYFKFLSYFRVAFLVSK